MQLIAHRAIRNMKTEVANHCVRYHYLERYPDPRSLPFSYYLQVDGQTFAPDGRLWGLVVMKKPQHMSQRGLFGWDGDPTHWQVLDLARVWIHPELQHRQANGHAGNIFSQMVSRVIRRVQWDWLEHHPPRYPDRPYHIELIISYCELSHHDGTAYRASGFQKHGLTSDGTKEVYFRRLHPPRKSWTLYQLNRPGQLPLFEGSPIKYD